MLSLELLNLCSKLLVLGLLGSFEFFILREQLMHLILEALVFMVKLGNHYAIVPSANPGSDSGNSSSGFRTLRSTAAVPDCPTRVP
jgi:hypothetical protein